MRALVYTAPGKVDLEQRPRPEPHNGEEEIAIEVAGVCGSDISGFLGHSPLSAPAASSWPRTGRTARRRTARGCEPSGQLWPL